jgi:predicted nucleotidyltransferase
MDTSAIMNLDKNLPQIKKLVSMFLPGSRVILFGSRAWGNEDAYSDYDILVISSESLNIKEKRQYAGRIRKKLASSGIPVDIIVKTEADVSYYRNKIGSLVREAVRDGISL